MSDKEVPPPALHSDRFRQLVESVQDYGIFMLDPDGIVLSWNIGASRLKGYSAEDVIGKHFSRFYPETARLSKWPAHELQVATEKGKYEEEGWRVRKDGSMFWANVIITALRDESGELTGFGKVTRDLTEKRENEERLRQSEERFRMLIESVKDYAIYMLDPDGVIMSWNRGAQLIKGYAASEVIGKHYSMFFRDEDKAAGLPAKELREALTEGRTEEEGWRLRRDGSAFWANVVMTPVIAPGGMLLGFAKVTRDMTEKSRIRDLEQVSRRMNDFLEMVSKQLRNPDAPVRSALALLKLEQNPSDNIRTSRDLIEKQLANMTHLVEDLLETSRLIDGKIQLKQEPISFIEVANRAIDTWRQEIEARSQVLDVEISPEDISVSADPTRLQQILEHLLGSAANMTPSDGAIKLAAKVAGDRLRVEVSSSGSGTDFESNDQEMDFDFFSEKAAPAAATQNELALGLSLVRSLVEMHGGSVSTFSKGAGDGNVFRFELPGAQIEPREV